ncbi:magnesium transporter [Danxiaibacter flavus]|uniref:Magnesium transporter n=1 Tax=Danxiaibacter flavus TaxID=3049108 RepID=A0ABV3ZI48_9BACT|nr:magnesium transporter [Chitinophagaceae bacterium DXS]
MHPKNFKEKIIKGNFSALTNYVENARYVHATELAQLLASLPEQKAFDTFHVLPVFHQVKTFPLLSFLLQQKIIQRVTPTKAAHLLNEINADDRIIFFSRLQQTELQENIDLLNTKNKASVIALLAYPQNSIARCTNTSCITITKNITIGEANELIRNNYKDDRTADIVYVVDAKGRFLGDIPARRILMTDPSKHVEEVIDDSVVVLHVTYTKTTALALFREYNCTMLPVVDEKQVLIGAVALDNVERAEEEAAATKLQCFGGVAPLSLSHAQTTITTLVRKKVLWLLALFILEACSLILFSLSKSVLNRSLLFLLFIPIILAGGGNAGTQSASLVSGTFSSAGYNNSSRWRFFRKEFATAVICALILGAICFAFITICNQLGVLYDAGHWSTVAFGISASLASVVLAGSVIGTMLPLLANKFKLRYPLVSAPLVNVATDIAGIALYFFITNNLIDQSFP